MTLRSLPAPPRRAVLLLLTILVLLELVSLSGIVPAPHGTLAAKVVDRPLAVALFTAFLVHLRSRPTAREIAVVIGLAALALGGALAAGIGGPAVDVVLVAGMGLGEGSLLVLAGQAALARGDARRPVIDTLALAAVLPLFFLISRTGLSLSAALHPTTYDGATYYLERALGGPPSFVLGRILAAARPLRVLCEAVYAGVPLAAAVHVLASRAKRRSSDGFLDAFLAAGLVGLAIHHACPVAGPRPLFGDRFPAGGAALASFAVSIAPGPVGAHHARAGVPALRAVWALLIYWHARPLGPRARALAGAWLGLTLLAALGLGAHYTIDLVVAVPFAIAVDAALAREVPRARLARLRAVIGGAGLTLLWILVIRNAVEHIYEAREVVWALVGLTLVVSFALRRDLDRVVEAAPEEAAPAEAAGAAPADRSFARVVAVLFFCSGFSGLVYEVVFEKSLALSFGNTAQASATVLATYMGGMALGAWTGGRLGARRLDGLRLYAFSELGIAVVCAISPVLFAAIRAAYVALATGVAPGHPGLVILQSALGSVILLPATVLMGITLPVLTRELLSGEGGLGWAVSLLYGANTLGAAAGAIVTGYFLLPFFGVTHTTWLAVGLNLLVALVGLRLAARRPTAGAKDAPEPTDAPAAAADPGAARERWVALAVLFGGGAITLALEVAYTHLLAVAAGNSVYAFSLMLFTFLVGLGLGAALIRPRLRAGAAGLAVVGALEIGLAIAILAGVFVWESIPEYFASFAQYPSAVQFGQREFIRFVMCAVAMAPPAILIGALYPAALEVAARAHPRGPVAAVGRASALNTAGNIAGALAGSFLLLPHLGSLRTLHALAALALALGLLPLALRARAALGLLIPAGAALILFAIQPRSFDLDRLASGANVYFYRQGYGRVIDHAESVSGGLTTVARSEDPDGTPVLTLLTNGKFQGDNSPRHEMKAQFGFALVPLLHTDARESALVIGFGTGGTVRAMRDAGFARTDVVELSADILHLADQYFRNGNDGVLSDPTVHAHITDGRNYLLVQDRAYDIISIEVTSIWFAGAASLYNQEFYQLVKKRLRPRGVLQQWIQLHHLSPDDIVSILATVRVEFPFVRLYVVGSQGLIVACGEDCPARPETIAALDASPRLREVLGIYGGSAQRIAAGLVLDPHKVEVLLGRWISAGADLESMVSTDDNMRLEYATPRGNVMPHWPSLERNLAMLGVPLPSSPGAPKASAPAPSASAPPSPPASAAVPPAP